VPAVISAQFNNTVANTRIQATPSTEFQAEKRPRLRRACSAGFDIQFTTTVNVMLWFRLPEVAVIVAEYVPGGVPGVVWVDEPLPPHPTQDASASMTIGKARAGSRLRLRRNDHPEPSKINAHAKGIAPGGKEM